MVKRKIIEIDEERCTGCGNCVTSCAEGALAIVDGKAKVVNEVFCDGLGACIGECPEDALRIVEREAPEFDEEAVKEHLDEAKAEPEPCGCPASTPMLLRRSPKSEDVSSGPEPEATASELANWPVQWRLVQPSAPFFKGADLLIAADCVPFAHAGFHRAFIKGRPLVIGCPKLDEQGAFLDKLSFLFRDAVPKSVTVVVMEVPCCSGLVRMVQEAIRRSGRDIPLETHIVGIDGRT
ncbi:TPA: 4Fe-4S binding protein [Thermoplasmata archaeon]|nr:4Fe-4S binding protein [Thermoplasmata archaeon]